MPSRSRPHKKLNRLYSRSLTLIDREIEAIDRLSKYGEKLPTPAAKDLRDYIKLLKELKEAADRMEAEYKARAEKAVKAASDDKLLEMIDKSAE